MVGNLRLTEYFDFRFEPGLVITQRNLIYPNIDDPVDRLREVKSTYIFFPFLLKYSAILNNAQQVHYKDRIKVGKIGS